MEKILIERLQPRDAKESAEVLAIALMRSPGMKAVYNNPASKAAIRSNAAATRIVKLERKFNVVYVAKIQDKIVGVLNMVKSPNCHLSPSEQLKLVPRLMLSYGVSLFKAFKIVDVWAKHDPSHPHWHIGPVGVLPEYQGRGIGSQLLVKGLKHVDLEHMAGYLEADSEDNVRLYEKMGFRIIRKINVHNNTNWLMWRNEKKAYVFSEIET